METGVDLPQWGVGRVPKRRLLGVRGLRRQRLEYDRPVPDLPERRLRKWVARGRDVPLHLRPRLDGREISSDRCELHCFNGGHPNADCSSCIDCDHNLWNTTDQCRTCRSDMCMNGELNDACECECELGWTGERCATSWCNVTVASNHRSVWSHNFTTTLSHRQWLVHDGATMLRSGGSHSVYIVLSGGNLSCDPMRPGSYDQHNTFYAQAGGTVDTNCLQRDAGFVKLMYEDQAVILWPYPNYDPAGGFERQSRNASGIFPLGLQPPWKRTIPCPLGGLITRGTTHDGDCFLNCGNGGAADSSCQR